MQINVSWTSMQVLPLGLSYLLIISYILLRQKLSLQRNTWQINLKRHFFQSQGEAS